MSGIAEVLLNLGYEVSGSDLKESDVVARLRVSARASPRSHDAGHVEGVDVVVVLDGDRGVEPRDRAGPRTRHPRDPAGGDARPS